MIYFGKLPAARKSARRKPENRTAYVLIIVLVMFAGCCGAYRWFIYDTEERPPDLTAEYKSSEALLVSEELAGQIIVDLPIDEDGLSIFGSRSWETDSCLSGWDNHLSWDGFVSVSVGYGFDIHEVDLAQRIEHAHLVFDKLEDLGLEPVQEPQGDWDILVSAERDDGLWVQYSSRDGLEIGTDCVVQEKEDVYTPPHVRIPPARDYQDFASWPESD